MFEDKINSITEKVIKQLLINENYEQSSKPGGDMNAKYIYHCANQKDIPSIFKFGFERFYFGKGIGQMYGPGIYCTTDLQSSIVNSYRGLYGPVIVRAEIKSYNRCLIWESTIAKEVYGGKWRIQDQLEMFVPEYIEEMKRLPIMVFDGYSDGCRNMYDFIVKPRERNSVGGRQIWAQRNNFRNGSPYDKIRGFVFYGSADGHTAVLKDAKNAIPLEYSIDHGKTWKYARTEETLRYTKDDFDVELDYGKKYTKTYPVEYGFSRVQNKDNKFNFIDKNGKELTTTWFDGAGDFYEIIEDFKAAVVVYNGKEFYLTQDGDIYETLEDDAPYCSANELPKYA